VDESSKHEINGKAERVRSNQIEHQRDDADDYLHSVSIIGDHMGKYRIRSKIDVSTTM
jgi:hypothetical protein